MPWESSGLPGLFSITERPLLGLWLGLCVLHMPFAKADDVWDMRIKAEAIHSDNGALVSDDQAEADWIARTELHNRIRFEREHHSLKSNYRIINHNFSNDTQNDNTIVEGQTEWYWEPVDQRFAMTADHSRFRLVRDNTERFTEDNQDQRTITSVGPTSRIKLSAVDALELSTSWTDVNYADGGSQNSDRWISGVSWIHALSPISTAYLSLTHQSVDFDSERAGYDYYQLSGTYLRRLRNVEWSIQLGRNKIERDSGTRFSGFSSALSLDWSKGYHRVKLGALADITDSSLGNRNQSLVGDIDLGMQFDFDSEFREPDATDRTSVEMLWETQRWVCDFCATTVFFRRVSEEFLTSGAKRSQTISKIALTVQPSNARRYIFAYEPFEFERRTDAEKASQRQDRWQFSAFHKAMRDLELGFQLSWRERDGNSVKSEELRSALSLEYSLF